MTHYRPSEKYPGYYAGDDGSVMFPTGRVSFGTANKKGYLQVSIKCNGEFKSVRVNRFICEVFHGSALPGMEAAHIDGVRSNNRPDNLIWKTHKDNEADKEIHGTKSMCIDNLRPYRKISENDVRIIRQLYSTSTLTVKQIASRYGLDNSAVGKIISGKRWPHVEGAVQITRDRGRPRGESNHRSKITDNIVRRIRAIHSSGKASTAQIAKLFDIDKSNVAKIVRGERWEHVK
jgi:DNA-binding MarR family transcriptional regulator